MLSNKKKTFGLHGLCKKYFSIVRVQYWLILIKRGIQCPTNQDHRDVLLAQFSLYVHKGGLKPDSFYFIYQPRYVRK